jgi:hypothetical protein
VTNGQPLGRVSDQHNPFENKVSRGVGQVGQVFNTVELQPPKSPEMPESGARLGSIVQENLTKNLTMPQDKSGRKSQYNHESYGTWAPMMDNTH